MRRRAEEAGRGDVLPQVRPGGGVDGEAAAPRHRWHPRLTLAPAAPAAQAAPRRGVPHPHLEGAHGQGQVRGVDSACSALATGALSSSRMITTLASPPPEQEQTSDFSHSRVEYPCCRQERIIRRNLETMMLLSGGKKRVNGTIIRLIDNAGYWEH